MNKLNGKVDLHIHTSASDGTWEPDYIMELAKKNNIGLISITDHDDTKNVKKAKSAAQEKGIAFLEGIEISSTYGDEMFHILAYGIDTGNERLQDLLSRNRFMLEKKDEDFIKRLIEHGCSINIEDYEAYQHEGKRGGWKALSFLIDAGLCIDVGDFFKNLFTPENAGEFPVFPSPEEVVKTIEAAGGIAVLAHPYYYPSDVKVSKRLGEFKEMGLKGFECYHPNHSSDIIKECTTWCRENGTIITSGSDCHGEFIPSRQLGVPETFIEHVNLGDLQDYIYK